jgi:hypothetical protein
MFVVITLFVHQYCRWIGLWSVYNMWQLVCHRTRCRKLADGWKYYCPHSSRIDSVLYSNTLRYSDLNDVLTVCLWWVLHIVMDAQILGVDATRFLLVNLLTKRRTTKYDLLAHKELIHILCIFTFNNFYHLLKDIFGYVTYSSVSEKLF